MQPHASVVLARPAVAVLGALLALTASSVPAPAPAALAPVVSVSAGYRDQTWAPNTHVHSPTKDKPQSKVWFTDGSWWGALFADDAYRIHRYDSVAHDWVNTGVAVDTRASSHGDYLWDEASQSLYVASVSGETRAKPVKVFKLNYNAATGKYTADPDFGLAGLTVGQGPTETVTIAKDSTGQLWVTYQNADPNDSTKRRIMVNRSTTAENVWGTPFALDEASADDISAITAFGGDTVGVMWSDQNPVANQTFFYFATHTDATADDTDWSAKQSSATGAETFAEDHINLKLVATDSGRVLAAVKANEGPDKILLLERNAGDGSWTEHVVESGTNLEVTRPQVVVDAANELAYVFYTKPTLKSEGDQAIYYKAASLASLDFSGATETPFISDAPNDISNISTPKQPVTTAMGGIIGIASSDTNDRYYHGWIKVDATVPVASAPTERLVGGWKLSTSRVPLRVSWATATDPAPSSGIAAYEVAVRRFSGGTWGTWQTVSTTTATSVRASVSPGTSQFRVRAQDGAGNWSSWKEGASFRLKAAQSGRAIDFGGTWSTDRSSKYFDGSARFTSTRRRTATYSFVGRQVAWVAVRGPNRGRARVYIDGSLVQTVDLYRSTRSYRRIVFSTSWASVGSHTIRIRVITKDSRSTGRRVDVDAFLALR